MGQMCRGQGVGCRPDNIAGKVRDDGLSVKGLECREGVQSLGPGV